MASLSESSLASIRLFGDVRSRLVATEFDVDQSGPLKQFDDEFGRLRLWASNTGAHQKGQSSLDFRLRDASNIRDQIRRLLDDLRDTLRDVEEFLDEREPDSLIGNPRGDVDRNGPESDLEQICQSLVTCVDCLFQMSIIVRRPARHDFIHSRLPAEILSFQRWYEGYIKDKFPKAKKKIADRLAFAMMRRKHFLGYREKHRAKLAHGLDSQDDSLSQTMASREIVAENLVDTQSEAGTSTSSASTISTPGDITMPRLPSKATVGRPFECPYCYIIISVTGLRSWYKHVFEDIQPYVCIVPECTAPATLFSSRRKWTEHLQDNHSQVWWDWESRNDSQPASVFAARCLLCMDEAESETQLIRHLSEHMQEIALFCLPRPGNPSDRAEDGNADDTSDESERFISSNEVQTQKLSASPNRVHDSHNDAEEPCDDSGRLRSRARRPPYRRSPSPQYDSKTRERPPELQALAESSDDSSWQRVRARRLSYPRPPRPQHDSETEERLQKPEAADESSDDSSRPKRQHRRLYHHRTHNSLRDSETKERLQKVNALEESSDISSRLGRRLRHQRPDIHRTHSPLNNSETERRLHPSKALEEPSDDTFRPQPIQRRRRPLSYRTRSSQYESEMERRLYQSKALEDPSDNIFRPQPQQRRRGPLSYHTRSPQYNSETEKRLQKLKDLEEKEARLAAKELAAQEEVWYAERRRRPSYHRTRSPQYDPVTERRLQDPKDFEEKAKSLNAKDLAAEEMWYAERHRRPSHYRTRSPQYSSATERRLQNLKDLEEKEERSAAKGSPVEEFWHAEIEKEVEKRRRIRKAKWKSNNAKGGGEEEEEEDGQKREKARQSLGQLTYI